MHHQLRKCQFEVIIRFVSQMNTLRGVDLNLLVVLEALLAERHVSRAAVRLNMSQPAVSHALARLRQLFDDPLLIRRNGRFVPSARALELAPALAEALRQVREVLGPPGFDPAQESRTFRLAMSDYGSAVVLPGLATALRAEAPGVALTVRQASREAMIQQVMDGDCDLALGVFPHLPERVESARLFLESFACLADRRSLGAAAGDAGMSMAAYLARPHLLVAMSDAAGTEIDAALQAAGHARRVVLTVPHWGVAPRLVAGTDLVLTVARKALAAVERDPALAVFPPPFAIPPFPFVQAWHQRRTGDPAHQWLRATVARVAAAA